jgi:Tfp pilus assembly protein PilN
MIRINLLPGQRPVKAKRPAGPSGAGLQAILLLGGAVIGGAALFVVWTMQGNQLAEVRQRIEELRRDKQALEQLKIAVEGFQRQEQVLKQRIAIIQELQRNKVGGQELLDVLATLVNRTETLWLTLLERKGNQLKIEGTAASITAVANFITQLKRAGYFEKIEIKESKQDEKNTVIQTFLFTLTADFVLPGSRPAESSVQARS